MGFLLLSCLLYFTAFPLYICSVIELHGPSGRTVGLNENIHLPSIYMFIFIDVVNKRQG